MKKENYIDYVKNDCFRLREIPEEEITPELCEIAVSQNGKAIRYIPL